MFMPMPPAQASAPSTPTVAASVGRADAGTRRIEERTTERVSGHGGREHAGAARWRVGTQRRAGPAELGELAAQVVGCDDAARTRALLQEFAAAKLELR